MPASTVDLINRALTDLGQQSITDLSDANPRARAANRIWEIVRDEVLTEHQWNEAVTRTTLAQLASEPEFGFDYQYQLPTDFLRLVRPEHQDVEYRIEGDKLLAHRDEFSIVYVSKITDVTKMRAGLAKAIAKKLAAELCLPLTGDGQKKQYLEQEYRDALLDAKYADSQQAPATDRMAGSSWIDARITGQVPGPHSGDHSTGWA